MAFTFSQQALAPPAKLELSPQTAFPAAAAATEPEVAAAAASAAAATASAAAAATSVATVVATASADETTVANVASTQQADVTAAGANAVAYLAYLAATPGANLFASLPTTKPATSGHAWINGRTISKS